MGSSGHLKNTQTYCYSSLPDDVDPAFFGDDAQYSFFSIPSTRSPTPVFVSSVPRSVWSGSSRFDIHQSRPSESMDSKFRGERNAAKKEPPRRDVTEGKGVKKRTEKSTGTSSGRGNQPNPGTKTGSKTAGTDSPTPPVNYNNNNNNSDEQEEEEEEEEEVVQESKILLGMPQNPHYRPLLDQPRSIRRYLIFGYDKSFVETGKKIQKMAFAKEFETSKDELRKTLKELEKMGYDAGPLTRRLDALEAAVGGATEEAEASRAKIEESRRKVEERKEERKEELSELRREIKRLQTKADEKQEGIDELTEWARDLQEKLPDVDAIFAKMARTPML